MKYINKLKPAVAGATFMVVFGIIDNLFLIIGMDSLSAILPNIDATINGGIGNTISDAVGVILGASISRVVSKLLKINEDETTFMQQLVGITIGCLIPIVIYALI